MRMRSFGPRRFQGGGAATFGPNSNPVGMNADQLQQMAQAAAARRPGGPTSQQLLGMEGLGINPFTGMSAGANMQPGPPAAAGPAAAPGTMTPIANPGLAAALAGAGTGVPNATGPTISRPGGGSITPIANPGMANVMAGMQAAQRLGQPQGGSPAGGGNTMAGITGGGPGSTLNQRAAGNPAAQQAAMMAQMNRMRSAGVPPAVGGVPPAAGPPTPGPTAAPIANALQGLTQGAGAPPPGGPPPGMGMMGAGGAPLGQMLAQQAQARMAAAPMGGVPGMMAKGGKVLDADSDTPAKKNRPARQWGNVKEEAAPVVTKLARGGNITVRRPPKPKAKMAAPPKKPVPTPSPYDYEADEGTAPTALPSGPGGTPPLGGPGMAKGGKFIQKAIKHPGALHKQLGVPQGQKIPAKKLASAAKAPGKLGQRARLAETLKGMNKNKGGKCDDRMAKGGKFNSVKALSSNLPTSKKKFAVGGAAKERKGFPNTTPPPKPKAFAEGGKVRGCGIATKGCGFAGIF